MKPVVIIGLAVVCSVIGVFGLLVGIEMYEMYQFEKSAKFGLAVESSYQKYHNEVKNCIPNDYSCLQLLSTQFNNAVGRLSQEYGIDPNGAKSQELANLGKNFLQIEYDYQNGLYQIEQDFRYQQYQDEVYYGSGNVEQDRLVFGWQQAYRESLNNMRIEMAGREETVDEDSLDYQFIKQFEELTKQKQEEDP